MDKIIKFTKQSISIICILSGIYAGVPWSDCGASLECIGEPLFSFILIGIGVGIGLSSEDVGGQ